MLANLHPPFTIAAANVFAATGCKEDLTARLQSPAHP